MNTPLPPDHDDELPGEAELAALYRKLPKSEPGPALDAAVLRAAAEALASGNDESPTVARRPQIRTSRTRWLIPLSSAATLVLAAGLAWHMRSMPAAESAMTRTAAPQVAPVDAPSEAAAPPTSAVTLPASPSPQMKAAPPAEMLSEVTHAARQPAPRIQMQDRLVPPPSAMKPKKAAVDKDTAAGSLVGITVAQPTGERMAAPAPPSEPSQSYASTDAARSLAPPPVAEMSIASADKVAANDNEAEVSRPAPAPMAAPMPMAVPALRMRAAPDATEKDFRDTPAQEFDKIRRLFAAHRDDEAKARLEAFQREHPDQKLPADLRARLPGRP